MRIEIFNVEHGACALITADNNARIMIDCGHNSTTGWKPGDHLQSIGVTHLEQLIITNYDEDHVSGIKNLFEKVSVGWLARNTSISPADIRKLKTSDGMGPGIEFLIERLSGFLPPGSQMAPPLPTFPGISWQPFFHSGNDFDDENNLSVVVKLSCRGIHFLFTGDMEKAGWKKMLLRQDFLAALNYIDIFIAPHHGRIGGYCEELFQYFMPTFVVVSDKSLAHETQETVALYAKHAKGGIFDSTPDRKFITTRSDGDLVILPDANGNYIFRKANKLGTAARALFGL